METKLIMLSNPILVSDEKIKEGDFYFKYDRILQWVKETSVTYTHIHPSNYPKPIIAGLPELPKLDLSLIAEEIGWVDVYKLAYKYIQDEWSKDDDTLQFGIKVGFRQGFETAQSLNEKKYTLADVENAFNSGRGYGNPDDIKNFNSFIQSLSKPKEYLVEYIQEGNTIKVTKIIK